MKKINFYQFSEETLVIAPKPEVSSKFLPDWYKKTPPVINNGGISFGMLGTTVKKCMPIFDLISAGYIISTPCDIYLDATNPERLEWSIPSGIISLQGDMFAVHAKEQYENLPINKEIHHKDLLRIFPFWAVGTPKGYSALFLQPAYADGSPLTALQALVDTDNFITDGHLSFLVEKGFKGTIKQGTPLIQIIPFKRESWSKNFITVEKSEEVYETQRLKLRAVFSNAYKNLFRSKKEYY
jgi:hypothetical protein